MAVEWSNAIGIAGAAVGVAVAIVQARQKNRIDELAAAQAVIKLKQEEIDGWKLKYDGEKAEKDRLQAENSILSKLFRWDTMPAPLQTALDQLSHAVETMLKTMNALEALITSETGRLEDERH